MFLKQTKSQDNQALHLYFITDFANLRKEESKPPDPPKQKKKIKKLSQTLRDYNLLVRETILVCGVLKVEGICTMKMAWSYVCAKIVF